MEGWIIEGTYQGKTEAIDCAETQAEAEYLAREFRIAYGPDWLVSVRKARPSDDV